MFDVKCMASAEETQRTWKLCILGVSLQIWNCVLFSIKRSFFSSAKNSEHIDVLECCNTRFKDLLRFINFSAGNCMKMACRCCRSRNILMLILVLQMVSVKILRYFAQLLTEALRIHHCWQTPVCKGGHFIRRCLLRIYPNIALLYFIFHIFAASGCRTAGFRFSWFYVGADYCQLCSDCLFGGWNFWSVPVQTCICHSCKCFTPI